MRKWPMVPLGEFISHRKEFIQINDIERYKRCRVQLHARGIVIRDHIDGAGIKTKKQQVCRCGELLVAEIDAKHGGYGIVPDELDGAIVSSHYFLFEINEAKLDRSFLGYYIKTPTFFDQVSAQGSTNYAAIRPGHVLDYEIPFTQLPEQQKVVDWIDGMVTRVDEAKVLVEQTTKEIDDVTRSILWTGEAHSTPTPMSDLVKLRTADVEVTPDDSYRFAGVYCFGRGVFAGQTKSGMEFKYPKLTRLRARNFTYPKLMAWEGAFGVVPEECDGLVVSTEFPVFEINEDKVLPEVLDVYFKTPSIWSKVAGASTGTNVRRRRLNPKDFLKYEFPLPSRETQQKIAQIRSHTEGILRSRKATVDELDGLVKSVLNQVFNGEGL